MHNGICGRTLGPGTFLVYYRGLGGNLDKSMYIPQIRSEDSSE